MCPEVERRLSQYDAEVRALFDSLRALLLGSVPFAVEERLWAGMPSYSHEGHTVRLVPCKDHVNIVAGALWELRGQAPEERFTPTGMLKVYPGDALPPGALGFMFHRSLTCESI